LTVEVKAKALPLRALAQRDCKKCFLYGHCDYILYAICTEFEKGRNTKGEKQYDKELIKRLGVKSSKQVLLDNDKDTALLEFKVSYKNLMKVVFTQSFGDGLKLIQQARETEKKTMDELSDEMGLPFSVRHEIEK